MNIRCMDCMREYDDSMSVCPHCGYRRNQPKSEPYYLSEETILTGRYLTGRVISEDSFGLTYIAWDLLEECKVVIKEYLPKDCATRNISQDEVVAYDGEKANKFADGLAEYIETAQNLINVSRDLEGIVRIKDSFIENSTGYYVMEYLDGASLSDVLKGGKMSWRDIISIVSPVMVSLQRIHDSGLGNYNISPENIVMTRSHEVKLRGFESVNLNDPSNRKRKKATSEFSAYEMYQSDGYITQSADVYSLAAVIYYAVTGVKPPLAVDRYTKDNLVPPSKMGIKIPQNAETALLNALNVEPAYRTKSVIDFMEEINSTAPVKRKLPPKRKIDSGKFSKRTKIIIAIAAAVTACLIVGIFSLITFNTNNVNTKVIKVPDFTGLNYSTDKEKIDRILKEFNENLKDLGANEKVKCVVAHQVSQKGDYSEKDENDIVAQTPEANRECDVDTVVAGQIKLTTVRPPESYKMPYFVNQKYQEAKKWCEKHNITPVLKNVETNNYTEGCIFEQSEPSGSWLQKGDEVIFRVAKPIPTTAPPATKAPTQKVNNGGNSGGNSGGGSGNSGKKSSSKKKTSKKPEPKEEDIVI